MATFTVFMLFVFLTAHKGDDDDDYGNFANFVDLKKKKTTIFFPFGCGCSLFSLLSVNNVN